MSLVSRAVSVVRSRRLDLSWMEHNQRRWARAGVTGIATAGLGVVVVGLGVDPTIAVTPFGDVAVLPDWVVVAAHLGLALTTVVLLQPPHRSGSKRIGVGILLALVSASMLEYGLRPLSAALGDLGLLFDLARVLTWLALAIGAAMVITRPSSTASGRRVAWLGAGGFVLLAVSHSIALAGLDGTTADLTRAALSRGIATWATQLSLWLFLFVGWQVIEGIHASMDTGSALVSRSRRPFVLWALIIKMAVIVAAIVALPPIDFPDWEVVRSARPFAWGYAAVMAGALLTVLRDRSNHGLEFTTLSRAAGVVVGIWAAPFLIGLVLVGAATFGILVLPSSAAGLVGLGLMVCVSLAARSWLSGPWSRSALAATLLGMVATAAVAPTSARWFSGVESSVVATFGRWIDRIDSVTIEWQAGALILMPLICLVWLVFRHSHRPLAVALAVLGVWILPRAVSTLSLEAFHHPMSGVSPNLLMLDIALTIGVLWQVARARSADTSAGVDTRMLGLAVAVTTVIAYGAQVGGMLVDGLGRVAASVSGADPDLASFLLLLVLPAAYAFGLGATDLNSSRSDGKVFAQVGTSCLLLVMAIVLIPLEVMQPGLSDDDVLRALITPGLTLLSILALSRGHGTPGSAPDLS